MPSKLNEMNMPKKLNFPQKIGYFWFRLFDPSGYIFYLLKDRLVVIRWAFYAIFVFGFFGISYFLFKIQLVNYLIRYDPAVANLLGSALFVSVFSSSLFLPLYESLYKFDLHDLNNRKNIIKREKAQWWRFRNMRVYSRFSIYFIIWFFGVQIVYWQALLYFAELHPIAFAPGGGVIHFSSSAEMEKFSALFSTFVNGSVTLWSLLVLVLIAFFEYRVRKIKNALLDN